MGTTARLATASIACCCLAVLCIPPARAAPAAPPLQGAAADGKLAAAAAAAAAAPTASEVKDVSKQWPTFDGAAAAAAAEDNDGDRENDAGGQEEEEDDVYRAIETLINRILRESMSMTGTSAHYDSEQNAIESGDDDDDDADNSVSFTYGGNGFGNDDGGDDNDDDDNNDGDDMERRLAQLMASITEGHREVQKKGGRDKDAVEFLPWLTAQTSDESDGEGNGGGGGGGGGGGDDDDDDDSSSNLFAFSFPSPSEAEAEEEDEVTAATSEVESPTEEAEEQDVSEGSRAESVDADTLEDFRDYLEFRKMMQDLEQKVRDRIALEDSDGEDSEDSIAKIYGLSRTKRGAATEAESAAGGRRKRSVENEAGGILLSNEGAVYLEKLIKRLSDENQQADRLISFLKNVKVDDSDSDDSDEDDVLVDDDDDGASDYADTTGLLYRPISGRQRMAFTWDDKAADLADADDGYPGRRADSWYYRRPVGGVVPVNRRLRRAA